MVFVIFFVKREVKTSTESEKVKGEAQCSQKLRNL